MQTVFIAVLLALSALIVLAVVVMVGFIVANWIRFWWSRRSYRRHVERRGW